MHYCFFQEPYSQMPFTLHQNAGDADKQGASAGEGLPESLHPPFTSLLPRAYIDNDSIISFDQLYALVMHELRHKHRGRLVNG